MPPEFMAMIQNLEQNLKAQGVDPEKLAEDPEGLGKIMEQMMGGGGGGGGDMQNAMQNMMQQMMGKDVLAEPMKQLKELYPPWFANHGAAQSTADLKRYKAQYKLVQQMCNHFDNESDDPEKISELMQQMQEHGTPPPEIMQNLSPGNVGPDGAPMMAGPNGDQCAVQ